MITTTHVYKLLMLLLTVSILGVTPKIADNSIYTEGAENKVDYAKLNQRADIAMDSLKLKIKHNISEYKK